MTERKVAIVLHGINVSDGGKGSVAKVAPWLVAMGYDVLHFEYGRLSMFGARFFNDNLARALASEIRFNRPKLIVSHSNGATLEHRALAQIEGMQGIDLVRIAPALDRDLRLPASVHRCAVVYNAHDWVIRLAARIPWAVWGSMGAFGPDSDDERFLRWAAPFELHSNYFREPECEAIFRPGFESLVRKMETPPCERL